MKTANECRSLPDIREGIDAIDHHLVTLLAQRLEYVLAAAQFKPTIESIPAPERVERMLTARVQWAKEQELDPQFVTGLFQLIIPWYIKTQTAHWQETRT